MNKRTNKVLFKAIEDGDEALVFDILDSNEDALSAVGFSNANCRDKTPLMYALQCANFQMADELINRGADVNARMPGGPENSVLELVAVFGHPLSPFYDEFVKMAERLIGHGAQIDGALRIAIFKANVRNPRLDMIRLLLAHGGDLDRQTPSGTIREMVEFNRKIFDDAVLELVGGHRPT